MIQVHHTKGRQTPARKILSIESQQQTPALSLLLKEYMHVHMVSRDETWTKTGGTAACFSCMCYFSVVS